MRALGLLLVAAAAVVGAAGAGWAFLALVGREWDYCPRGGDCIPGELVGLTAVAVAAAAAWLGVRVSRSS